MELTVGGDGCREGERDLHLILQPLTIYNLERRSGTENILKAFSTRACLRFACSVDPMVPDPTSDNGCLTIITPVSPSGPKVGMVPFPAALQRV